MNSTTPQPFMSGPALPHIVAEIRRDGPMSFARFMELALYHPEAGYYASGRAVIGRRGDFFTSVSAGTIFGRLLAVHVASVWEALDRPARFTLVEQGAGSGDLAADILSAVKREHPALHGALEYCIIEPAPRLRAAQEERLAAFAGTVAWHESAEALPAFTGIHLSNELVDAMPVHLVRRCGGQWRELRVDGETLQFRECPVESPALAAQLAKLPADLPDGYETEIPLAALDWIRAIAARLEHGLVLVIDYGYPRPVYYDPARTRGTLSCYAAHRRSFDPLAEPGAHDITAHVEFTSLAEAATASGLTLAGFTDQHHFLVHLARRIFEDGAEEDAMTPQERRAFMTVMHPEFMGTRFHALALSKGMPEGPLAGFESGRTSSILCTK